MKTMEKVEQGKGTADHLMPLSYLLELKRGTDVDNNDNYEDDNNNTHP